MEQSWNSPVTMEEIEVANILLELPHLILESELLPRFATAWGTKMKRSTRSKQPVVAATYSPPLKLSPPPPPPSSSAPPPPPPLPLPSNVVVSTCKTEEPVEKTLTSSPLSPLSFSPSESDEKPLPPKKKSSVNSLKRKKDELLEVVNDLTLRNELLKKEIENVRRYRDQQKSENLELIAKKQKQLSQSLLTPEESHLETSKGLNLEIQITQNFLETDNNHHHHHQQQQQEQKISARIYQQQPVSQNSQYPFGQFISLLPSSKNNTTTRREGLSLNKACDNVIGLLDLNVSPPEEGSFGFGFCSSQQQSIDLDTVTTKVRAAQARLIRKQICRSKNHSKPRFYVR